MAGIGAPGWVASTESPGIVALMSDRVAKMPVGPPSGVYRSYGCAIPYASTISIRSEWFRIVTRPLGDTRNDQPACSPVVSRVGFTFTEATSNAGGAGADWGGN